MSMSSTNHLGHHLGRRHPDHVDRTLATDAERTIAAIVETARALHFDCYLSIRETGRGTIDNGYRTDLGYVRPSGASLPGWHRYVGTTISLDDRIIVVSTTSTRGDDGSTTNPTPVIVRHHIDGEDFHRDADVSTAWELLVQNGARLIAAHP